MGIKLKASYETEIYTTEGGYVALKQADPMGGPDTVVLFSADQIPHVIKALQWYYDDRISWEGDPTEDTEEAQTPQPE